MRHQKAPHPTMSLIRHWYQISKWRLVSGPKPSCILFGSCRSTKPRIFRAIQLFVIVQAEWAQQQHPPSNSCRRRHLLQQIRNYRTPWLLLYYYWLRQNIHKFNRSHPPNQAERYSFIPRNFFCSNIQNALCCAWIILKLGIWKKANPAVFGHSLFPVIGIIVIL